MAKKVDYKKTDADIFASGIIPDPEYEKEPPLCIKTDTDYLKNLISLKIREKKESGNLYITYPNSKECEDNAPFFKARYENTILVLNDGKSNGSFDPEYIRNAKRLQEGCDSGIVLTSLETLQGSIPVFDDDGKNTFVIRKGSKIDISKLSEFLTDSGYYQVPFVQNGGDFSIFGEVINIFPVLGQNPIRIYIDFDEVEKMFLYDPSTEDNLSEIDKYSFANIERQDSCSTPFSNIISDDDTFVFSGMNNTSKSILGYDGSSDNSALATWFNEHKKAIACEFYSTTDGDDNQAIAIRGTSETGSFQSFKIFNARAKELIAYDWDIRVFASSVMRKERIKALLDSDCKQKISFEDSDIPCGFYVKSRKLAVFSADEIFNKKEQSNIFSSLQTQSISDFTSLRSGDLIVHYEHGIGKFIGFDKIEMLGRIRDYIKLEYADKEFFYIPLEHANQIEKYIGSDKVRLDRLHSAAWSRKKEKAKRNAMEFADKLIRISAKRKMSNGFCHARDTDLQLLFEEGFEKEETEDQLKAIADVKRDMESNIPMDRIICGDVGFGKTEIAFRACFKAIMSGKQVCFVAPTTILTSQHYGNFKKRCEKLSQNCSGLVRIAELSRIKTRTEALKIIDELKNGTIDIVFATHRVLQKDVGFKNLGLLVIDEEQRFGVSDKERIREIKANIDTLTLTATPIPRTLYMSLMKLKDVSLLTTPPKQRIAVDVVIKRYDETIMENAISNELERGGQVFYLHNNTETIPAVRNAIAKLFPKAKVDYIHGKMENTKIEKSIYDFANGWTDVLVSTTIIENGIDVPNANTLIVDNATIYGTSQLYQIKGRVGRGSRKAIAYLFYPENGPIKPGAIARLKVISENKSLGAGFDIAMNDLALRGAGNILSKEQSGHIAEVGLETYMRLLDECIKELEAGKASDEPKEDEPSASINITCSAYVPDEYISATEVKFRLYKQLARAKNEEDITSILSKIETRYGTLPPPLIELYRLNLAKILCRQKKVSEINESADLQTISITFGKVKDMNFKNIMALVGKMKGKAILNSSKPNVMMLNCKGETNRLGFLIDTLRQL